MRLARKSSNTPQRRQPSYVSSGSRQPAHAAYYSNRKDSETNLGRQQNRQVDKPKREKLLSFWMHRFGLLVLLIVCVASVISALSLSGSARIIILKSTGSGFLRSQSVYQKAADDILAKSIFNRNKITIDTASLNNQMLKQFPELDAVSVVLPMLAHRPIIYLTPPQPTLIISGLNGNYILDNRGKALLQVADMKTIASLKLPLITDQSGLKLVLGQRVLSSVDITFIQTIIAELAAKQVSISSLTLPVASREIDAGITGQPYVVKFNLQGGSALQQAGTFLALKSHLTTQNIVPAHYIDVRVPGRAYYQ